MKSSVMPMILDHPVTRVSVSHYARIRIFVRPTRDNLEASWLFQETIPPEKRIASNWEHENF